MRKPVSRAKSRALSKKGKKVRTLNHAHPRGGIRL